MIVYSSISYLSNRQVVEMIKVVELAYPPEKELPESSEDESPPVHKRKPSKKMLKRQASADQLKKKALKEMKRKWLKKKRSEAELVEQASFKEFARMMKTESELKYREQWKQTGPGYLSHEAYPGVELSRKTENFP